MKKYISNLSIKFGGVIECLSMNIYLFYARLYQKWLITLESGRKANWIEIDGGLFV
jgi:hypothetical protein